MSERQDAIDGMVAAMADAPTGNGLPLWEAIAAYLYDSGYRATKAPVTPTITSDLLATGKAAKMLGVTPQTIRDWSRSGLIKVHRMGPRNFRVHKDEVQRLLVEAGI